MAMIKQEDGDGSDVSMSIELSDTDVDLAGHDTEASEGDEYDPFADFQRALDRDRASRRNVPAMRRAGNLHREPSRFGIAAMIPPWSRAAI